MELKSINEIFSDRILRIPSYQRGYSWGNDKVIGEFNVEEIRNIKGQLMDLWGDIVNIPENKWHYTGLLTLVEAEGSTYSWLPKEYKQFSIVDGQQRITSILILISVLIEEANTLSVRLGEVDAKSQYLYKNKGDLNAYVFGYDKDNPSDKYFRKHILGLNKVEDDSRESVYTENLKKAKVFFKFMVRRYLDDSSNQKERLQYLFGRVTEGLKLNEYVLPKDLDENVVFETMNNRGKPLSELEKLKNRLMYLCQKFDWEGEEKDFVEANKVDLSKTINTAWTTIYQSLGDSKDSPLDDDDFIKNHWIAYFGKYSRAKANAHATYLFNEFFTLQKVIDRTLTADSVRSYVASLQECSVVWNNIHHPNSFGDSESSSKQATLGLHRAGFRASFRPLVLAAFNQKDKDEVSKLINILVKYAFKIFHISNKQSNTGDSKLYRLASKVYHSEVTLGAACEEVNGYIKEYYDFNKFKIKIDDLFDSNEGLGFYGWSGLHYFLYEYDQDLRKKNVTSTQSSALNWDDFNGKNTIEHIYPQSAAKNYEEFGEGEESPKRLNEYNKLQDDWSAFKNYSDDQRKRLCNSLGNLLAISRSDNASFSNDKFEYKIDQKKKADDQENKGDDYKNRGYRYDSISAQIVATSQDWTPESIKDRGVLMLKSMLSMLGESADVLSENDALSLLGLDFFIVSSGQPNK
jgi:hypothetical protein